MGTHKPANCSPYLRSWRAFRIAIAAADVRPETGKELPAQFRRTLTDYDTKEPTGTIVIDTVNTYLYLVLGNGKALRYGIGARLRGPIQAPAFTATTMPGSLARSSPNLGGAQFLVTWTGTACNCYSGPLAAAAGSRSRRTPI